MPGWLGNEVRRVLMQFQFKFVTILNAPCKSHSQCRKVCMPRAPPFFLLPAQNHEVIAIPRICEQFRKLSSANLQTWWGRGRVKTKAKLSWQGGKEEGAVGQSGGEGKGQQLVGNCDMPTKWKLIGAWLSLQLDQFKVENFGQQIMTQSWSDWLTYGRDWRGDRQWKRERWGKEQ